MTVTEEMIVNDKGNDGGSGCDTNKFYSDFHVLEVHLRMVCYLLAKSCAKGKPHCIDQNHIQQKKFTMYSFKL